MSPMNKDASKSRMGHYADRRCGGSNWTAINIAAMVVAFVFFWPLGLFMIYWICTGRDARDLPGKARDLWQQLRGFHETGAGTADNLIFNEYQQTQYDRIREIKAEISERSNRFKEFRMEQKRKKDQDEFNLFMTLSPTKVK